MAARPDKALKELCVRLACALIGLTGAASLDGQQKASCTFCLQLCMKSTDPECWNSPLQVCAQILEPQNR